MPQEKKTSAVEGAVMPDSVGPPPSQNNCFMDPEGVISCALTGVDEAARGYINMDSHRGIPLV